MVLPEKRQFDFGQYSLSIYSPEEHSHTANVPRANSWLEVSAGLFAGQTCFRASASAIQPRRSFSAGILVR
jgi:hypothetical protein